MFSPPVNNGANPANSNSTNNYSQDTTSLHHYHAQPGSYANYQHLNNSYSSHPVHPHLNTAYHQLNQLHPSQQSSLPLHHHHHRQHHNLVHEQNQSDLIYPNNINSNFFVAKTNKYATLSGLILACQTCVILRRL